MGFLLPVPLIRKYAKNSSIETAQLVAPVYNPAIRQALSCTNKSPIAQKIALHQHSMIVYGPGTSLSWETDGDIRQYNRAVNPDWVVGVGGKPEIVIIVAKGQTTSTGSSFRSCLGGNCIDAGEAYRTTWGVEFVSLPLNAIVRTELLDRSDVISHGALMDSIDRNSQTPPDTDDVIDVIKRVVTWQ